jgi:hypothetical protein
MKHQVLSAAINHLAGDFPQLAARKRRCSLFVVRHSLKAKTRKPPMAMQPLLFYVFYE